MGASSDTTMMLVYAGIRSLQRGSGNWKAVNGHPAMPALVFLCPIWQGGGLKQAFPFVKGLRM